MRFFVSRQFVGGLLGGICGIVAFGVLYPFLLPLGCFAGFTVGFLHRPIWKVITTDAKNTIRHLAVVYRGCADGFRSFGVGSGRVWRVFCWLFTLAWVGLVSLAKMRQLRQRLAAISPKVRSRVANILAGAIVFLVGMQFGTAVFEGITCQSPGLWRAFLGASWMVVYALPFSSIISTTFYHRMSYEQEKYWDERLAYYAKVGWMRFFFRSLWTLFVVELVLISLFTSLAVYGLLAGVATGLFLILPVALMVWSARLVAWAAREGQYWTGLAITLVTTAASAWVWRQELSGQMLWLVALATGVVAGSVCEGVLRLTLWLNSRRPVLDRLAAFSLQQYAWRWCQRFWVQAVKLFQLQWVWRHKLAPEV